MNNGRFAVYEADAQYPDSLTQEPINQFTHRAIYGVSRESNADGTPNTQFAIVRTGAYVDYGFGGFIYQRDNNVVLQEDGQALFRGQAAGIRDFSGKGDLQYSTSDVEIAIDFDDFNNDTGQRGDAIQGTSFNRRVFNTAGDDVTSGIVDQINAKNSASLSSIPEAIFKVGPGVLDANGDAVGELDSSFVDNDGIVQSYEEGKYYAIVSGEDPNEIVGVVVLTNSAEIDNVEIRGTSGFIVYREDE